MLYVFIALFTGVAAVNIFTQDAVAPLHINIKNISKALLMPLLMLIVLYSKPIHSPYLLMALFFSWMGDVWLIGQRDWMFLGGLTSFLVGHIAYVLYFNQIVNVSSLPPLLYALVPLLLWYGVLLFKGVQPKGTITFGLIVYMLAIGSMIFMATANMYAHLDLKSVLMLIGALLFGSSDSVLAFQRIKGVSTLPDTYVMFSYISGQFLIILSTL